MNRRMIDASMWQNERFAELPMAGRLLLIGIINHADDQGRVKANPVWLRSQIFPYDNLTTEEIQSWLDMLAQNETIILYSVSGKQYAQLANWWKYQSLQYAQPSQYPRPDGWLDRIRKTVTKGFIATCNWYTVDGTRLKDTCDMDGQPINGRPNDKKSGDEPRPQQPPPIAPTINNSPELPSENGVRSPVDSPERTPAYSPEGTIELNRIEVKGSSCARAHARMAEPEKQKPAAAAYPPEPTTKSKNFETEYERVWGLTLNEYHAEKVAEWAGLVTFEGWSYALQECADNRNAGKWKYLESILRRVANEGVGARASPAVAPTVNGYIKLDLATV